MPSICSTKHIARQTGNSTAAIIELARDLHIPITYLNTMHAWYLDSADQAEMLIEMLTDND